MAIGRTCLIMPLVLITMADVMVRFGGSGEGRKQGSASSGREGEGGEQAFEAISWIIPAAVQLASLLAVGAALSILISTWRTHRLLGTSFTLATLAHVLHMLRQQRVIKAGILNLGSGVPKLPAPFVVAALGVAFNCQPCPLILKVCIGWMHV